jgi:drug/metabolite transporter (DMT)-like permease
MTPGVFLAVLAAAAMHAVWNAMIKVRLDRFASISLMSVGMGLFAAPVLPFVPAPQGMTWFWLALSTALHTGYKFFLAKSYETGDLAQSYPLARGTAPLLTTFGGIVLLHELPSAGAALGILLLCSGTLLMSLRGGGLTTIGRRAAGYALLTSVFIAGYTLSDGTGARGAASATAYAAWLFLFDGVWSILFVAMLRGRVVFRAMLPEWRMGVVAGFLSAFAYWIAMWAMTKAPIAAVAALRETSILFAMLISVAALGEVMTRWRAAAALFIVAGVIALRLG